MKATSVVYIAVCAMMVGGWIGAAAQAQNPAIIALQVDQAKQSVVLDTLVENQTRLAIRQQEQADTINRMVGMGGAVGSILGCLTFIQMFLGVKVKNTP